MSLWELVIKSNAFERACMRETNNFRRLASIVISPYAKKGQVIDPRKIWPIEGEVIPKASTPESYQQALEFFRNRNWKVKKVLN